MVKRKSSKTGTTRVSGGSDASKESKEEGPRPTKLARTASKRTPPVALPIPTRPTVAGNLLVCGQGDVGQLGLGEDVMEKSRPALLPDVKNVVDVAAGGMHSIVLTKEGELYSFGCNDEGALGRDTSEEGSEFNCTKLKLPGKVVKVSAGDSHTACLLEDGRVFAWGSFRDSHGNMGLTLEGNKKEPVHIVPDMTCVDIASGADHLVILTQAGKIFTVGCAEQGQLGRLGIRAASGESRRGKTHLLSPELVQIKFGRVVADAIWASTYCTFLREKDTNKIYAFGLNNYNQLGLKKTSEPSFTPKVNSFNDVHKIAGGSHHTLVLKNDGKVYAIGRKEYGRLGLGKVEADVEELTVIPKLADKKVTHITCGDCTSFALTDAGEVFAWGIGTNSQLGTGNDEDVWEPVLLTGAQVKDKRVITVAGGAQHTLFTVEDKKTPETNGKK
ncbi:regulator of chromosome condensation [Culicoides brevitarsis]|uniref:regulator of chromosome condensation n=1 Tax=Culicoides brevitarsis TaxID=469753 RepID=UPI00307C7592